MHAFRYEVLEDGIACVTQSIQGHLGIGHIINLSSFGQWELTVQHTPDIVIIDRYGTSELPWRITEQRNSKRSTLGYPRSRA